MLLAPNGQVGLARALEVLADLMLTDLRMAVMDGPAGCRQFRSDARTATIRVIGMRAASRPAADDALDAVGARRSAIPVLLAVIHERLDGVG